MRSALWRVAPGHVHKLISWRDHQALLHMHNNALDAAADGKRVHVMQEGIFVWAWVLFFPCPVRVYRSSRKPAALLATVTVPLPLLLWEFANIWASAQETAHAPEFTSACWPVWENYKWRWKHLWKAGSPPHFFWGLLQNSFFVLFLLLPSTFFIFWEGFTLQSGLLGNGGRRRC